MAGHAGRVLIADIGDLHRRRLAGKDQQPIAADVAGQVDQDIDPVLAHQFRGLGVGHAGNRRATRRLAARKRAVTASGWPTSA